MRAQEFVTDEINKQVFSPGWTDETTILNRYVLKAQATDDWNKYQKLDIEVFDPESGIPFRIAHARFRIKPGFFFQKNLEASMIYVSQEYQKRGIATAIYQYVRKLGNTIKPSRFQLPAGKSMWKSFDRTDALAELDEPTRIKLGSSDSAARAWIDRVYQLYPQTFQNNHVMPLGGSGDDQEFAMFELVPSLSRRGAVEVKWFQAYPLRQGVGSRAMQQLQQLAREDGISLTLFPWDKGQVSQSKLTKFYRGQGFSPTARGSKAMQWTPDQPGVAEGSQEINWVKPNFDFEWHEVEEQSRMKQVPVDVRQYYQKHFPNKDAWLKAVQNGKAVVVPPDHAYEIRNAPFDKASLQKVLAPTGHEGPIGPAKEKRVNDLFDKGQVEMPIILKTSQGLWLIGGKTRLGTANYVKGLPAKVWLISGKQGVAESEYVGDT